MPRALVSNGLLMGGVWKQGDRARARAGEVACKSTLSPLCPTPRSRVRARWVVERTFAWPHHFERLLVRYDRRHEIHEAFLALGCCLVCFRRLRPSF